LSDGFKFDEQGYLWTSIPNGFAVIDTTKHEVICQILLGVNTSNLAFGTNGDVWLTGKAGVWKITRHTA
jgi:sugar lactone lactonase YvrE